MRVLLGGVVIASIGCGLVLLAIRPQKLRARVAKALSVAMACLSLPLLSQVGTGTSVSLQWIPGAGSMGLDMGAPGICLAIGASCTLALALVWPVEAERSPPPGASAFWPGLALILSGLVIAALTADHFLARYVVLEMVAFCTLLAFLMESPLVRQKFPLWRRYFCFRIGDVGLISAILLLWHFAGTFDIKEMLAAALLLDPEYQLLIAFGVVLAVWVKMGLPPFHGWLLDSSLLSWEKRTWLTGAGLPVLGAYLLYRFNALIGSLALFRIALNVGGMLVLLWLVLKQRRSDWLYERSLLWLIGHGGVGFLLVGTPLMRPYLLTFLPLRMAICVVAAARQPSTDLAATGWKDHANPIEPQGWLLGVARWAAFLEGGVLEGINRRASAAVLQMSRQASLVEHKALEGINRRASAAILRMSRQAYLVEHKALEGINRGLADGASRMARVLQSGHTGRLRRNLLWSGIGLVVLLFMALITLSF